jgi:hypothetical protein
LMSKQSPPCGRGRTFQAAPRQVGHRQSRVGLGGRAGQG